MTEPQIEPRIEPLADPLPRHLSLAGAYNIRDLGGYPTGDGRATAWRRFLRADSPHRLDGHEVGTLRDQGVATVIDLRTRKELDDNPNPFARLSGVEFVNLPLFDDLAPAAMARTRVTDSGNPLFDFYIAALTGRQGVIREVLSVMAGAERGAVMFHCTAGKDRTGLIAALLLSVAGVGRDLVLEDYAMTRPLITGMVEEFLETARSRGADLVSYRKMLACDPGTLQSALRHIEGQHRTIDGYLADIGVGAGEVEGLRARLVDAVAGPAPAGGA